MVVVNHVDGNEGSRDTCCFSYFNKHQLDEAGGSRWVIWWLLMVYRLLCGGCCLSMGIVLAVYRVTGLAVLCACLLATGLTFALLGICTALNARLIHGWGLATAVIFLHTFTVTLTVFMSPDLIFIAVQGVYYPAPWFCIVPIALFIVDVLIMQAKIRIPYRYGLPSLVLYMGFAIWQVVTVAVDVPVNGGVDTLLLVGTTQAALIIARIPILFIIIGFTHIPWCCISRE